VDCAGVVTGAAIIKAFSSGADGVLVAACGRGDCHYSNGNESCERVVEETRGLLKVAGVQPERLRLDLSSDVDGGRFVELLEEFSAEISSLRGAPPKRKPAKKPAKAKKVAPRVAKKAAAKKTGKAAPKKVKGKAAPKKAKKKAAPKKATKKKATKKTAAKRARKPARKTAGKTRTRAGRKR
jgi:coenzyme F420-reducing hydrogenase delta subunit